MFIATNEPIIPFTELNSSQDLPAVWYPRPEVISWFTEKTVNRQSPETSAIRSHLAFIVFLCTFTDGQVFVLLPWWLRKSAINHFNCGLGCCERNMESAVSAGCLKQIDGGAAHSHYRRATCRERNHSMRHQHTQNPISCIIKNPLGVYVSYRTHWQEYEQWGGLIVW